MPLGHCQPEGNGIPMPVCADHAANGDHAALGRNATFTAAASGLPAPTVQWQASINNLPFAEYSRGDLEL